MAADDLVTQGAKALAAMALTLFSCNIQFQLQIDGLVQERHNSSVLALLLRLIAVSNIKNPLNIVGFSGNEGRMNPGQTDGTDRLRRVWQ